MSTSTEDVKRILQESHKVAVLGAHPVESKAAHYVPRYLAGRGYEVYPVNPVYEGGTLFGREIVSSLVALTEPVDLIDVFRRSEHLPDHVSDILEMTPLPKVVWFQLGIQNDEVAKELEAAGITVVQNRCMLADHQRLL